MIGLVLVTHGRLAAEFVVAMEHVVGPQEAIEAVCIGPDDDMEARRQDIADAIGRVDWGKGVIILTDLFGGTPSNLAISLMKTENIEVIAGVILPMLIRLEGAR
jgi:mannose PTS system EIIA component